MGNIPFKGEAGCNMWRIADQKLDVETKGRNVLEVFHEHVTVAGQLERSAIVFDILMDLTCELIPILPVQTVNVAAVEIGK